MVLLIIRNEDALAYFKIKYRNVLVKIQINKEIEGRQKVNKNQVANFQGQSEISIEVEPSPNVSNTIEVMEANPDESEDGQQNNPVINVKEYTERRSSN